MSEHDPRLDLRLRIAATGLACPVGLTARTSCAAIRAGLTRIAELEYLNDEGEPINGAELSTLARESRDERVRSLLTLALRDIVSQLEGRDPRSIPVLLLERPDDSNTASRRGGRGGQGDDAVFDGIRAELGVSFHSSVSRIFRGGSARMVDIVHDANALLRTAKARSCIVAASDSLINAADLLTLQSKYRLRTMSNSDGVAPGEAAACLLLESSGPPTTARIAGIGKGLEIATLDSEDPLRADGLCAAIRDALRQSRLTMNDLDFRLADAGGEGYDFKEQTLALIRLLRQRERDLPLWLHAQSIGTVGVAAGFVEVIQAVQAITRGYAPGGRALCTMGDDNGPRGALVIEAL